MTQAMVDTPTVATNTEHSSTGGIGRVLRWAVVLALAGISAWLSLRQVHWRALQTALAQARVELLALALGIVLVTTLAKSARWQVLLRSARSSQTGWRVLRVLLIGQLGNTFLPARLGDVARVLLLGPTAGAGYPGVLGTLVAEKALDGVVGLVVLIVLSVSTPLPAWLRRPALALAAITGLLLLFLALAAARQRRAAQVFEMLADRLPTRLKARLMQLVANLGQGLGLLRAPRDMLLATVYSAVVWGSATLTNSVVLSALGIQAPGWSLWLVVVAVYAATFLPTLPAQMGVFEYACVLSLRAGGVSPEASLAAALTLHLIVLVPVVALGSACVAAEGLNWTKLRSTLNQK